METCNERLSCFELSAAAAEVIERQSTDPRSCPRRRRRSEPPRVRGRKPRRAADGFPPEGGASVHGTHVASIIFGQPGGPVEGIAPSCRGLIIPVFPESLDGGLRPCSPKRLAEAIHEAVSWGAHVINVSGGQILQEGSLDWSLLKAVERCASKNVLVVAAGGNGGCNCALLPAALPSVLAVGALAEDGNPLSSSNWGASMRPQGVVAPGERIIGAVPGGGLATLSGTSFATPIVAGAAALLLSLQLRSGRKPDPRGVREAILQSADPCRPEPLVDCRRFLAGCLNGLRAAHVILKGGTDEMLEARETGSMVSEEAVVPELQPGSGKGLAWPASSEPMSWPGAAPGHDQMGSPPWFSPPLTPASAEEVNPACACGGGPSYLVYPVGNLTYDFGTEARLSSFKSLMSESGRVDPFDPRAMAEYLRKRHFHAAGQLTWVLHLDGEPMYALAPSGAFALATYRRFRGILLEQIHTDPKRVVQRIVVPGVAGPKVRLYNGAEIPTLQPDFRGWGEWNTHQLAMSLYSQTGDWAEDGVPEVDLTFEEKVNRLLRRLLQETKNRGAEPRDRAKNFAATSAVKALARVRTRRWSLTRSGSSRRRSAVPARTAGRSTSRSSTRTSPPGTRGRLCAW